MPFKPHPTDPNKMVYTPPRYNLMWPKREWVGLTEEEVYEAWRVQGTSSADINTVKIFDVAERIQAKLKEKNS